MKNRDIDCYFSCKHHMKQILFFFSTVDRGEHLNTAAITPKQAKMNDTFYRVRLIKKPCTRNKIAHSRHAVASP